MNSKESDKTKQILLQESNFVTILSEMVSTNDVCILITDEAGHVQYSIGSLDKSFGYNEECCIGKSISSIFEKYPNIINSFRQAFNGKSSSEVSNINDKPSQISIKPASNYNLPNGAVAFFKNKTQEHLSEMAFQTSDLKFRIIFNNSNDPIFIFPVEQNMPPGKFIDVNNAACEILGYPSNELLKMSLFDIESDRPEEFRNIFSASLFTDKQLTYETDFIKCNGRKIAFRVNVHLVKLADQTMAIATARDISILSQAEKVVKDSEEKYKTVVDLSPNGILVHRDYKILFINEAGANILGFEHPKEVIGKSILCFFHPEIHNKIIERIETILKTGQKQTPLEYTLLLPGNIMKDVEIQDAHLPDDEHSTILSIIQDISDRKKIRKEMFQRQAYLENLLSASLVAIITVDTDNRVVEWNPQAEKLFGYTRTEAMGQSIHSLIARPDVIDEAINYTDALINKKKQKPIETVRYRKDDKPVNVRIFGAPLKDGINLLGISYIYEDLEEIQESELARKETENTLRRTLIQVATALSKAQELKDPYTSGHGVSVSIIAVKIAEMMGWDRDRILGLELAGLLHDIGKLGVPIEILTKPTVLTDAEYSIIETHSEIGYQLLKDFPFPFPLAQAVYQHHERINGSGYPNGIRGKQIIPEAKILAVSDLLDAMGSPRPYRHEFTVEEVIEELRRGSGKLYDEEIVVTTLQLLKKYDNKRFWMEDR